MRQPIKLFLFSIAFLTAMMGYAQDQCKVVGWATQNGGTTGGGTATPTVVSTYAALKTALTTATVKVVHVSGVITFPTNGRITIQDTDGKTIIGLPGSRMISVDKTSAGSGILYVKRTTNLIMRNLTFEGPGAYDVDGNDNLTFDDVQNAWVDHCDFQDGMDGNFDMKNMTNYISVTWCKFGYNKPPIAGGSGGSNDHRFTDLIGSSDGATQDAGKLKITFQYCWWAQGCVERMPRVRFGQLHIANCFYNSTVSNSCIRAGYKADLLIESNVFVGVNKPIDLYNNDFTAVTARNNIFTNTSGGTVGSGTAFTPPYTLTIAPASNVQSLITNTACGTGATLDGPTQCGCGTPVNQNPIATLTAPANGSTACVGTAITITATATDDASVSKVDFYNGSTLLGSDNSSPYSITYTPTAAGTLSIKATATDGPGLTGTSGTNTVTVSAAPTVSISSSTTNLCTSNPIALSTTTGASYKWFKDNNQVATTATFAATEAGAYTVEVTNTGGCKAISAARTLTGTPQATPTVTSSTTNLCTSNPIALSTTTGASYKWFKDNNQVATTSTFSATEAGAYIVEVTNASGCKAISAARTLTGTPQATPTVTSSTTNLCTSNPIALSTTTGASYKWFKDNNQVATTATFSAAEAGAYTVEVTNASGCKAISAALTLTGTAQATPTVTSSTTNLCTSNPIALSTTTGASYKWFKDNNQVATTATFSATEAGAYTVEVTNASGCKAISAARTLTGTPQATPTVTSSTTNLCTSNPIALSTTTGASYKWFKDNNQVATTATFSATEAGAYTVEVTNASGCKAISAARTLTGTPQATPTITTTATSFCTGGSTVLTSSSGASYKWFKNNNQVATTATLTVTEAGAYTVEVTNTAGCKAISAVTQISITPSLTWYADTDNDGIGDVAITLNACTKPNGYVATTGDECPSDPAKTSPGICGCNQVESPTCLTTATMNGSSTNIKVVPQPFDVNTSITIENLGMIESITIISSSGAVVDTKHGINADSILIGESLASGLYTVIIQSETGIYTTKIVKK